MALDPANLLDRGGLSHPAKSGISGQICGFSPKIFHQLRFFDLSARFSARTHVGHERHICATEKRAAFELPVSARIPPSLWSAWARALIPLRTVDLHVLTRPRYKRNLLVAALLASHLPPFLISPCFPFVLLPIWLFSLKCSALPLSTVDRLARASSSLTLTSIFSCCIIN